MDERRKDYIELAEVKIQLTKIACELEHTNQALKKYDESNVKRDEKIQTLEKTQDALHNRIVGANILGIFIGACIGFFLEWRTSSLGK